MGPISEFSQQISNLVIALNISQNQPVNWYAFCAKLGEYLDGVDCKITCNGQRQHWQMSHQFAVTSINFVLPTSQGSMAISLLSKDTQHSQRAFSALASSLSSVVEMALNWQRHYEQKTLLNQTTDRLALGYLQLDQNGKLLECNAKAWSLTDKGLVKIEAGCVTLTQAEGWIGRCIKHYLATARPARDSEQWRTLDYRSINQGDVSLHAVLMVQPNTCPASQALFSLLLYPSYQAPVIEAIQTQFSLSYTEALVAAWYSIGLTADLIAHKTGYSIHTVYAYIKRLYGVLNINKQHQLTALVWHQRAY